ncbi:hypothetical protein AKJ09_05522 [Labilithrix luteola]|uniref:Uncharacterized protein n=2 Tax=Labilithrix luteola TaxID=1391654 RepID=A0A0K1PZA4_9BACT|nr:hypothetical protein AKJ09_05522 [Labilithrix luteola]
MRSPACAHSLRRPPPRGGREKQAPRRSRVGRGTSPRISFDVVTRSRVPNDKRDRAMDRRTTEDSGLISLDELLRAMALEAAKERTDALIRRERQNLLRICLREREVSS